MSVGGDRAVRAGKATRILTGRRMIAATVLRELRLLDAINIATRRNGRGGSDYKSLKHLGGHVDRRLVYSS